MPKTRQVNFLGGTYCERNTMREEKKSPFSPGHQLHTVITTQWIQLWQHYNPDSLFEICLAGRFHFYDYYNSFFIYTKNHHLNEISWQWFPHFTDISDNKLVDFQSFMVEGWSCSLIMVPLVRYICSQTLTRSFHIC